ncbi:hypothetical protein BS78_07G165900 [Paspalum vaginatum]|nr:hypothetical protein BS78_07G165900 [Paspalum vaginatum]
MNAVIIPPWNPTNVSLPRPIKKVPDPHVLTPLISPHSTPLDSKRIATAVMPKFRRRSSPSPRRPGRCPPTRLSGSDPVNFQDPELEFTDSAYLEDAGQD